MELKSETNFTQRHLPWVVAAVALALYALTSTRGISFMGLGNLSRVAGWSWQPVFIAPLYFLLTYPIHWLPSGWQIAALNGFSILCAALTLGLLARSVSLLPHDRTRDQRQNQRSEDGLLSIWAAWVPVTLAVLACGLQRTFWEHAVIGTGEALDLLIFAYVIRCLLEYRIDQRESWINRMAVVYGLGITNNFALIGFFPAVLAALIWIKGRSFFNLRFCLRVGLLGLAGLSLYLLLPITQLWYPHADLDFWQTLRMNCGLQKNMLLKFPRFLLLFAGLTSLLPVLFMGIKWPASFGDISTAGNALTNLMLHVMHGIFLVLCLYVIFDPPLSGENFKKISGLVQFVLYALTHPVFAWYCITHPAFSPRSMAGPIGYPLLSLYYLGALSIGYFSGYFLLIFGATPLKAWQRPSLPRKFINRGILGFIWIALVLAPVVLFLRNSPHLQATTAKYLSQFGVTAAQQLKESAPQGAVVLSDDPYRLFATYSGLLSQGSSQQYVLVDTTSLPYAAYHRYLHQKYARCWPEISSNLVSSAMVDSITLINLMAYLSQSNALFYLHPSFGYYFEKFSLQPRKLLYQLKIYPTNAVDGPLLSEAEAQQNDQFWKKFQAEHLSFLPRASQSFKNKQDADESLMQAALLYGRALDYLGVELQKAGFLDKAADYFAACLEMNPDSVSALRNQEVNRALRAGKREMPPPSEAAEKKLLDLYGGNLEAVLNFSGPIDDPVYSYKVAEVLARGRNYRQSAQYLRRVLTFEPQNISARIGLISLYNQIRQFDLALQSISQLRSQPRTNALSVPLELDLVQSEANAYIGRSDSARALKILETARLNYPTNIEPFILLTDYYLKRGDVTNALKILETEIKVLPANPSPLIDYARVKILNDQAEAALPYLNNALKLDGRNPSALFNRAIAHLRLKRYDAAETDYRELESLLPKLTMPVAYGLHEVAWQKKDRKNAIKYGKIFLELAPPNAPEIKIIQERLKRLKKGSF